MQRETAHSDVTSMGIPRFEAPTSAQALWGALRRGEMTVVGTPTRGGYELLLARAEPQDLTARSRALREPHVEHLEAVLLGKPQKVLAAELELAASSVASLLKEAAAAMGITSSVSRLPAALALMAHAAQGSQVLALCQVGDAAGADARWLLSLSYSSEKVLGGLLADGERDVLARYLEGDSHVQIAAARGVSERTVANQLGVCFRKLQACGRFGVLRVLVERGARQGCPVTLTLRSAARYETTTSIPAPLDHDAEPVSKVFADRGATISLTAASH